jgi:hypothetical protein
MPDNPQMKIEIPVGLGGQRLVIGLYTMQAMIVAAGTLVVITLLALMAQSH